MTQATITNPKNGKKYTITLHNGKAVGCSCNQKKALEAYSPFAKCMHMKEYTAPKPVVVVEQKQDQYPDYDTCHDCGKLIGKGAFTCYDCGC